MRGQRSVGATVNDMPGACQSRSEIFREAKLYKKCGVLFDALKMQLLEQCGDELAVIGYDGVVGYRHDGGLVVGVYAHDALGVLHTGKILR